jgi:hypothetical protein
MPDGTSVEADPTLVRVPPCVSPTIQLSDPRTGRPAAVARAGWRTACGDVRRLTHINEAGPSPRKMDARNRVWRAPHTDELALAVDRRDQQERNMGIGMQIAYFGFAGSAQLEAEASIQLMRLEPFSPQLAGCHLAIEAMGASTRQPTYDVRLDLITRKGEFRPVPHMTGMDPMDALKRAFDIAERQLAGIAAAETHENLS